MNLESVMERADIWRGGELAPRVQGVSSGFEDLDELLPERGWPRGALTEILTEREGVGAIRLLVPAMARLSDDKRWLALIAPPYIPYAPAFAGLHPPAPAVPSAGTDLWWLVALVTLPVAGGPP